MDLLPDNPQEKHINVWIVQENKLGFARISYFFRFLKVTFSIDSSPDSFPPWFQEGR